MRHTLILMIAMAVMACTNPKEQQIEQLKTEAIEVHDEVMPSIGEIGELSRKLGAKRKALVGDSSDSALQHRLNLTQHIDSLDAAYDAMMDWMDQFKPKMDDSVEQDSAIRYYERQLNEIKEVKRMMNSSLENAKEVE